MTNKYSKSQSIKDAINALKVEDDPLMALETYDSLSDEIKSDVNIAMEFVTKNPEFYLKLSDELKKNQSFNLSLVQKNHEIYNEFFKEPLILKEIINNKEMATIAIKKEPTHLFLLCSHESPLINDKDIILTAVKGKGSLLQYASEELKNDLEVVTEAIKTKSFDAHVFSYIGRKFIKTPSVIFSIAPIRFISTSCFSNHNKSLFKLKENLKKEILNRENVESVLAFEKILLNKPKWLKLIKKIDGCMSINKSPQHVMDEFHSYLKYFMPLWNTKTLTKLKNDLPDFKGNQWFSKKDILENIEVILEKELNERTLKNNVENIQKNKVKSETKKRKLSI
jgi:hypothetical protein